MLKSRIFSVLASTGVVIASFVANISVAPACLFYFYQPKIPERLIKQQNENG
jgi:cyclic lactone autoinducer peptide